MIKPWDASERSTLRAFAAARRAEENVGLVFHEEVQL
jgi:hypothetical protein